MLKHCLLAASLLAAIPIAAQAQDSNDNGWTGTGELGLALARGNSRSENLNGKLAFKNEDDRWKHSYSLSVLRAKGEVTGDFDGDGVPEESFELNANRYELGASSALKVNEVSSWIAALRYENDDFAPFESQTTFSIGYGHNFIKNDETTLLAEIGPGYRRAKLADTGEVESQAIVRGLVDYKHKLTANTELFNKFLVEAGSDNTFAQNDLGVAVSMNDSFALKAGVQVRHNTDVGVGIEKTDTLTTVNLVYNIK
jgi:putative salt-induced outer membrane protein